MGNCHKIDAIYASQIHFQHLGSHKPNQYFAVKIDFV